MQRLLGNLTLVIALAALITACSPSAGADPNDEAPTDEPTTEPTEPATDVSALAGTSWVLVEIMNAAPIAGTEITLDFSETEISGHACNSYFGSYTTAPAPEGQEWAQGLITISDIGSTDMACVDPEGAMEQESTYFNILGQISGYRIESDGRLVLEHPTMDPCCLIFEPAAAAPDDGDPLSGLSATLIDLNGTAPIEANPITITFEAGQASGSAGCNQFNSTYTLGAEGSLTFSPVITTKMACQDDGVMEQEAAFTALLESMTHYEGIAADSLTLTNANGESLTFALNMEAPVSSTSLEGEWVLTSLNGSSPLETTQITLKVEGDRLGGFGGCNQYGAAYQIGESAQIAIQSPERTAMLCEDSIAQEDVYLDTLTRITSYQIIGSTLEMYGDAGELLVYNAVFQYDMNPADLIGSQWRLVSINYAALPAGIDAPTIHFVEEGRVTGYAGCRDFEALYTAAKDDITFPTLAMLTETCESGDALIFEQDFTTLLGNSTSYLLEGDTLELFGHNGAVLSFERIP